MRWRNQLLAVTLVFLVLPVLALAQDPDPGLPDTVRVDSVATTAGNPVGVPVTLFNDEDLGGYTMPFTWDSPDIQIDSVSYIGTRLPGVVTKTLNLDNPNQRVLVGMVDFTFMNPLTPGDGLLFTLWFDVPGGTTDQFVQIDSLFYPPAGSFTLSPQAGGSVTPQFQSGKIKIGDPQPPPVIILSETGFTFNAMVGGPNPSSQIQQIDNGGGQELNWEAGWTSGWLGLNPDQGTAPSVVVVTANITGLSAGTHNDLVTVTAAGATNSPQTFTVTLNLTVPPPEIELAPDSFYFQALQDSAPPAPQDMDINNTGMGTLNWTATETAGWLDLSAYSGTAPSVVTLTADNAGLMAGLYTTTIEVSDPTASNDPQSAVVVFEIFSAFPVIDPDPDSVFAVASGDMDAYDHTLLVRNNGGGEMDWTATKTEPWMTLDIDTGTAVQGDPGVVMISFDRSLVGFGKHYDTITVSSSNASNSPVKVPVVFWKAEVPQYFNVNNNQLSFFGTECGTYPPIADKQFVVTQGVSTPQLNWTLTYSAPWLSVDPTSYPTGTTVTVSVDQTGLDPGVYYDTITVGSDVTINPPKDIQVTLTISEGPPNPNLRLSVDSVVYVFRHTLVGGADQMITIWAEGGGCLEWNATTTQPWLSVVPDTGTTLGEIAIRGDAIGLPLGPHYGEVIFTAADAANSPVSLPVTLWVYTIGDANGDGMVNITDVVYIINYIFSGGPAPVPLPFTGDADCNHRTDISDAVYLINWIFAGGPPPCAY